MIPAPFMARRDIVREIEAAMVIAVVQYANDPKSRAAWNTEALRDALFDRFNQTDPSWRDFI